MFSACICKNLTCPNVGTIIVILMLTNSEISYPCGMFSLFRLLSAKPSGAGSVSSSSGCESLLKSGTGIENTTLEVGLGQGEISKLLSGSAGGIKLMLSN